MRYGAKEERTEVCPNGENPTWICTKEFRVEPAIREMKFEIIDENPLRRDKPIGVGHIDLGPYLAGPFMKEIEVPV